VQKRTTDGVGARLAKVNAERSHDPVPFVTVMEEEPGFSFESFTYFFPRNPRRR